MDSVSEPAVVTDVYYGTDRARHDINDPEEFYGLERGSPEYGIARVAGAHTDAKPELVAVQPLAWGDYLVKLREAMKQADSSVLLVFIHGYNRSFKQISTLVGKWVMNTRIEGVPVIWSWPSSQNPAGYLADETNIRWARPHFAQFLHNLIEDSGAGTIHLIGHSLGARALTDVMLQDLIPNGVDRSKIGEYVLLAPDIDAEIFQRDLAPLLVAAGLNTTLYASANDKAMASARTLRGYPRAGDSGEKPVLIEGMETIDVTDANKSILGHSYFEESQLVGQDLAILLNQRKKAAQRPNLVLVQTPVGAYWRLTVEE